MDDKDNTYLLSRASMHVRNVDLDEIATIWVYIADAVHFCFQVRRKRKKRKGEKGRGSKKHSHLMAMLFALRWCHLWFISSNRRWSITASSWLAKELNSLRPVPFNEAYTSRCVSISDWRSCNDKRRVIEWHVSYQIFFINITLIDQHVINTKRCKRHLSGTSR